MGLLGKLSAQIEIKSKGDLFHQLWVQTPDQISNIIPDAIQSCEVVQGDWGVPGSTICWKWLHGGKEMSTKELIEDVDKGRRSIKHRVIEGHQLEVYKTFTSCIQVDSIYNNGETNSDHVTWIFEYEKLTDDAPDPVNLLHFVITITKDIDRALSQE